MNGPLEKSCESCIHYWPCSTRQDFCALAYKMERHNFIEGSVEDFITKIVALVGELCHFFDSCMETSIEKRDAGEMEDLKGFNEAAEHLSNPEGNGA